MEAFARRVGGLPPSLANFHTDERARGAVVTAGVSLIVLLSRSMANLVLF